MTDRQTLDEPVIICRLWKNRWRRAVIVISISRYENNDIIDIREHFTDAAGCMQPSRKGIAMGIRKLPELAAAVQKALARARALKLIDDDGGGG